MEYGIKKKISFHGKTLKMNAVFSMLWQIYVCYLLAFAMRGAIEATALLILVIYGAAVVYATIRRMKRENKYYAFKPGNPSYDYLAEYGEPEGMLDEIDSQMNEGEILFSDFRGPNRSAPETVITESWFVHLNKKAIIIPLEKIVCAYIYDNAAMQTPDERTTPSRFMPLYLAIVYGEHKVAFIKHTAVKYKEVLAALDKKIGCKINITWEMKKLLDTDYGAFLEKVKEYKENR